MIEFATLLIGLVAGERIVELSVQPPIVSVEILLDGQTVTKIDEPPWRAIVDFGAELQPHRLSVQGFNADGSLVTSTNQVLNYNRASFEVAILLDPTSEAVPERGRVVWRGALDDPPLAIGLTFDGVPIDLDSKARFDLPRHDPGAIHVLEANVHFDRNHTADAVLTFGGLYGDQTTSALTAVPIRSPPDSIWAPDRLEGRLLTFGKPARIFKTTAGPGHLVVLRGDEIDSATRGTRMSSYGHHPKAPPERLGYTVSAISSRTLKDHSGTFRITDLGRVLPQEGLRSLILRRRPLVPDRGADGRMLQKRGQSLWDALAVAGTRASSSGLPRAVLLMLDGSEKDRSHLTPAKAIRYLESIHVPLFVWGRDQQVVLPVRDTRARRYVGGAEIDRLCIEIAEELASQTIVWVQGEWIPSEITLAEGGTDSLAFVE